MMSPQERLREAVKAPLGILSSVESKQARGFWLTKEHCELLLAHIAALEDEIETLTEEVGE